MKNEKKNDIKSVETPDRKIKNLFKEYAAKFVKNEDNPMLKYALSAVFATKRTDFKTEEEFLAAQVVALIFESGENSDEFFVYKLRRLEEFDKEMYNENTPICCQAHFEFESFNKNSVFMREGITFITEENVKLIPVTSDEEANTQVFATETYHFSSSNCKCCPKEK